MTFQPGDRIWFKVIGTVISAHPDANAITIDDEGRQRVVDLGLADVELQAPVGWPPQPEDVWTMNGSQLFAVSDGRRVVLIDKNGNRIGGADLNLSIRKLTLADRPGGAHQ